MKSSGRRVLSILFLSAVVIIGGCQQGGSSASHCANVVKPVFGRYYKKEALKLIESSHKRVYVWMFEFMNYNKRPNPLIEALCRAKRRGVDVKVLVEGGEDFLKNEFYEKQMEAVKYVKKCGIDVRFDEADRTTHVKLLMGDTSLIIGSTNWTFYALERNNEMNALITGPAIESFIDSFLVHFKHAYKRNPYAPYKPVKIRGKIVRVYEKVSKRGSAYTLFKLKEFNTGKVYRIYIKGFHGLKAGMEVEVKGRYYKKKRIGKRVIKDEVEAEYIKRL